MNDTQILSRLASSKGCSSVEAGAGSLPVELGLGPLPWLWALCAAVAFLLTTELPVAPRLAAAALAVRVLPRMWRRGQWARCPARLRLPRGREAGWQLCGDTPPRALRLAAAGRLPGAGWLLRFESRAGSLWVWVPAGGLDRVTGRRLRAAITAGRT